MNIFTIKRNDTLPPIDTTLNDATGPIPLEDCTVTLFLAGVLGTDEELELDVEVVDADSGEVRHNWAALDTAVSGVYQAEWQVTTGDGDVLPVPNAGYDAVWIRDDLGPAGS